MLRLFRHSIHLSLIALVLAIVLAFGFVPLRGVAAQEATQAPVTIEFWHIFTGALADQLNQLIADFEQEHPNITVKPVYVPYDAMLQNVLSAVAAQTPPAIAQLELTLNARLASEGALTPIESLLPADQAQALKDSIIPSIRDANSFNGQLVTVPMGYNSNVLYYNPALVKAAGLDPAKDMPHTWDELIQVAQKLTTDSNNDGDPEVWGYGFPTHAPWILEVRLWQSGADIFNADSTAVAFNSAAGVAMFDHYRQLADSKGALPVATDTAVNQLTDLFAAGRIAMFEQSSTAFAGIATKATFDIGVSGFPTMGSEVYSMGGYNLGIFDKVSNDQKQAAATLAQWWASPEIAARWTKISNYMPGIQAAWDTDTLKAWLAEDPRRSVAASQMPNAHPRPAQADYPQISELLATAFEASINGQATSKDALDQAAQQADAVLNQ